MAHKVLLVDDEPIVTKALKRMLMSEPYKVLSTNSAQKALIIMHEESIDVVITDEKMPGMSGNELLAVIRENFPDTIRIVLTGNAEIETATRAINDGDVYRFLAKPCVGLDLAITLRRAIQYKELLARTRKLLEITTYHLEKTQPGITNKAENQIGMTASSMTDDDFDILIEKIDEIVTKSQLILELASKDKNEGKNS